MSVRRKLRSEDGAAAVEFALIVGVLAILVFGLLEYGLAFWQVQNLRAAAREGARAAAVGASDAEIRSIMSDAAVGSFDGGEALIITPAACTDDNVGVPITVEIVNGSLKPSVREAFTVSIPFLPPITLDPTISGTFRCEGS
jgi:Flp pilus assembly protein TadG